MHKKKNTYILLGIFFGWLGIHNLVAKENGKGIAKILITILSFGYLFWVSWIWAIIEVIIAAKKVTPEINIIDDNLTANSSISNLPNKTAKQLSEEYWDFKATKKIGSFFHIDEDRKKWVVPRRYSGNIKKDEIHNYSDIVAFELLEDGSTIDKSKGGIGRAAVGGLLFGGAGAIVGGLTASKKSNPICTTLKIKITINDINNPVVFINFISGSAKKSTLGYKSYFKSAQTVMSILHLITASNTIESKETSMSSVADELKKIKELLDSGVLNQTEFDALKNKLINN